MKKLFVSCPMNGRTEENIKKSMEKMHKIAEIVFDQKLEVIDSYVEENPPENVTQGIWYLGKSIQLLSKADYFIGIDYNEFWKGCLTEARIAQMYGIPMTCVQLDELMPDAVEAQNKYWSNMVKTFRIPTKI